MPSVSDAPARSAVMAAGGNGNLKKWTAEVFSSLLRSMSSFATPKIGSKPWTPTHTRCSMPAIRASARRRSATSWYAIIRVAFQSRPSGMSGL